MDTPKRTTLAATFATRGQAEAALHDLWHAGFTENQVGIAVPGHGLEKAEPVERKTEETATTGTIAGTVAGGAVGAAAGALVSILVPGIGPVLAGGIFAAALAGAAAGAATGSWFGPFVAMEIAEGDGRAVEEEMRAGRTVVVVRADDRADTVMNILRSHGGKVRYTAPLETATR